MNTQQDETEIITEPEEQKGLMKSARNFMNGVLSPLKGKDLGQMVEEYTSEMTLVAEGLSEDQQKLAQMTDQLAIRQNELEQRLSDGLHDADVTAEEMRRDISVLKKRLDKAEKLIEEKKLKRSDGLSAILRQATWLVAIAAGAWVIVTIINAFFKP